MLLYNLWLVIPISVSGYLKVDFSLTAADRLAVAPITTVIRPLVFVVVAAVAQFFLQFRVHTFLNQPCGQFLDQRMYAVHVPDPAFLDQLPHEALFLLCHCFFLHCLLFYLTISVYTIWAALSQKIR